MGFSENTSRQDGPGNGLKAVVFLVLLLVIAGTAGAAYLNSQDIDIKNFSLKDLMNINLFGRDESYEISSSEFEYDTNIQPVFAVHKGYIVKCTKDSIKYLDTKGKERWSFPVFLNNPVLKTSGSYLLAADYGGKSILVFSGKELKWEKELDNNIINVDISKNGYVSVIHDEDRYKGAATVFNRQGMFRFTSGKAENFIISSKVSPSGKKVFINSIDTSGVYTNSLLEFMNVSGTIEEELLKENTIFPSLWFMDDDTLFAVGDSMLMLLDKNNKEKWQQSEKGKIYSSCIADGKYAVVAVNSENSAGIFDGSTSYIRVYDRSGKQISEYQLSEKVDNITSFDEVIAVNSGRQVHFINVDGHLLARHNSKSEIKEAYFISRYEAILVYKDKIEVVQMK